MIAVGLCHTLHTPLDVVLRLKIADAARWYGACSDFLKPPADEDD